MLDRSVAHLELGALVRAAAVLLAVVLTALAAQFTIPLPFTAVPSTLTPLVVMVTGAVLGARLGFVTQALYLAAGAAGLPCSLPCRHCRPARCGSSVRRADICSRIPLPPSSPAGSPSADGIATT